MPSGPVNTSGVDVSEPVQDLGHQRREARVGNTDRADDGLRAGLASGPRTLKTVPNAELATHRDHVTERGMKVRREQESDAGLLDTSAHAMRRQRDDDAERLEDIRAAAT